MSERRRKLAWAAVIVASATAISRVVGLGREVITAGVYGVTADYNTFVSVSVVPNLIRQLFADAAISAAFVPVLTALLAAGDVQRARKLTGTLLGFMLAVVGAVCVVLILAAHPGRQGDLPRAHRHERDDARWRRTTCRSSCRPCSCWRSPACSPACSTRTSASRCRPSSASSGTS